MRFAVIGDIHSNKYALESVLADINNKNVDFIVSTGDLVGYLPFPNEVIELVRKNKIIVVQGNHDKFIGESNPVTKEDLENMSNDDIQSNASSYFTNWTITDDNRKYLSNLPNKFTIDCNGLKILIVHGSPRAIDEYLYEDNENLKLLLESIEEDIIICGHTHIPYHFNFNNKHIINVGSVGKPKHGSSMSTYAIVEIIRREVKSETIQISYDLSKITESIKENRMISNKLINMLEQGV
jgi:putative phosphoesterase